MRKCINKVQQVHNQCMSLSLHHFCIHFRDSVIGTLITWAIILGALIPARGMSIHKTFTFLSVNPTSSVKITHALCVIFEGNCVELRVLYEDETHFLVKD